MLDAIREAFAWAKLQSPSLRAVVREDAKARREQPASTLNISMPPVQAPASLIDAVDNALEPVARHIRKQNADLAEARKRIDGLTLLLDCERGKVTGLEDELGGIALLCRMLDGRRERIIAQAQELAALRAQVATLTNDLAAARAEVERLTAQNKQFAAALADDDEHVSLTAQVAALTAANEAMRAALRRLLRCEGLAEWTDHGGVTVGEIARAALAQSSAGEVASDE